MESDTYSELICPISLSLLYDPVELTCKNNHLICRNHVTSIISCPYDREVLNPIKKYNEVNKTIRNIIDRIPVTCTQCSVCKSETKNFSRSEYLELHDKNDQLKIAISIYNRTLVAFKEKLKLMKMNMHKQEVIPSIFTLLCTNTRNLLQFYMNNDKLKTKQSAIEFIKSFDASYTLIRNSILCGSTGCVILNTTAGVTGYLSNLGYGNIRLASRLLKPTSNNGAWKTLISSGYESNTLPFFNSILAEEKAVEFTTYKTTTLTSINLVLSTLEESIDIWEACHKAYEQEFTSRGFYNSFASILPVVE